MNDNKTTSRSMSNGHWFWIGNEIIKVHGNSLGSFGIAVYGCLACFAGPAQTCFPSQGRIAKLIGCSRATVNKTIKTLEQRGLICLEKQHGCPQRYRLLDSTINPGLQRCSSKPKKVSNSFTKTVCQIDTNNNHLTRINNKNNIDTDNPVDTPDSVIHKGLERAVGGDELLAVELADALDDRKNLHRYISFCRDYPESLIRIAIREALAIPADKIVGTRAALFARLIQDHVNCSRDRGA